MRHASRSLSATMSPPTLHRTNESLWKSCFEVLQALTSEGFSATLGVPQRPVSCEDHVAQWNMDIRFRKWTNRDVKSSIFLLDSSISAKARTATSSPPPRGLLSSAKERNVPVFLCFFFFIFVALFKRKNLTSELYIVQVRLHVCVNVSTCARVIFLVV